MVNWFLRRSTAGKTVIVSLAVLLVMLLYSVTVYFIPGTWSKAGSFGDSFGALNTFFSGLAFVGVIISIFIQRRELKLQLEELAMQREEMKALRKEHEVSRLINLLYKQIERVDGSVKAFQIVSPGAIDINLDSYIAIRTVTEVSKRHQKDFSEALRINDNNGKQISFQRWMDDLLYSRQVLFGFIRNLYSSCQVVEKILADAELEENEKKRLKEIFLENSIDEDLVYMIIAVTDFLILVREKAEDVVIKNNAIPFVKDIERHIEIFSFLVGFFTDRKTFGGLEPEDLYVGASIGKFSQ